MIMFVLRMGSILNVGYEKVLLLYTENTFADSTVVLITEDGDVSAKDLKMNGSDVTITTGNVTIDGVFDATGSDVTIDSTGNVTIDGAFDAADSSVTIEATGSIEVAEDITAKDVSTVVLKTTDGDVSGKNFTAADSTVTTLSGSGPAGAVPLSVPQ